MASASDACLAPHAADGSGMRAGDDRGGRRQPASMPADLSAPRHASSASGRTAPRRSAPPTGATPAAPGTRQRSVNSAVAGAGSDQLGDDRTVSRRAPRAAPSPPSASSALVGRPGAQPGRHDEHGADSHPARRGARRAPTARRPPKSSAGTSASRRRAACIGRGVGLVEVGGLGRREPQLGWGGGIRRRGGECPPGGFDTHRGRVLVEGRDRPLRRTRPYRRRRQRRRPGRAAGTARSRPRSTIPRIARQSTADLTDRQIWLR